MRTKHFAAIAFVGTALLGHAGNLVTNPGFETGDFTGWTSMAASGAGYSDFGVNTNPIDADSEYCAAFFAGTCPYEMILQNLATTVSDDYNFSFFDDDTNAESSSSDFQALWNGTLVQDVPDIGNGIYTEYAFTEEATSTTTSGASQGYNKPSDSFDDVSAGDTGPATVGELLAAPLVCAGLGLILVRRLKFRAAKLGTAGRYQPDRQRARRGVVSDHLMKCPRCFGLDVRRSRDQGLIDLIMRTYGYWPFRCRRCRKRFYRVAAWQKEAAGESADDSYRAASPDTI